MLQWLNKGFTSHSNNFLRTPKSLESRCSVTTSEALAAVSQGTFWCSCIRENCPNLLSGLQKAEPTVSLWQLIQYSTPFLVRFPLPINVNTWFCNLCHQYSVIIEKNYRSTPFLPNEASLKLMFSSSLAPAQSSHHVLAEQIGTNE